MSSCSTAMETLPQSPRGAPASFAVPCLHIFGAKDILKAKIFILRYPDFSCFILICLISQDLDAENIPLEVCLSLTSALSSSHHIHLSSTILQPPPGNLPLCQTMTSHQMPYPLLPVPHTSPLAGFGSSHSFGPTILWKISLPEIPL